MEFYAQAAAGQASLLLARQDAAALIEDPATEPALARRLRLVADLLRYAEGELALPAAGRYRHYVEVDGYPVWTVVAAPEFAVEALRRCYPVIGCAVYRGYFSRRRAEREAARLALGNDVTVGGAAAYSTLGWFDDPVFSNFLGYDDAALADLLFHELAHGAAYARGDSAFNEGYASFVGNRGALLWLAANERDADDYRDRLARGRAVADYLAHWRERLRRLYRLPIAEDAMRMLKAESFRALRACYRANRDSLGEGRYDALFAKPLNNAQLALRATYADFAPAFRALFERAGSDWRRFHRAVAQLARRPERERRAALARLAPPRAALAFECGAASATPYTASRDRAKAANSSNGGDLQ